MRVRQAGDENEQAEGEQAMRRWIGWMVVLLAGRLAWADSPPVNPKSLFTPIEHAETPIDRDATLVRRLRAEPTSLNPLLMFTAVDAEFDYLLWDRPIVLDHALGWRLNPAMAESYEESADHRLATLRLKPGLQWHDGAPYTAHDIVFSWRKIMDDRVVCRKARTGPDRLTACEAVDDRTVRYTFERPLPTNRWNVDFPIVPRHLHTAPAEADPTMAQSEANVSLNRNPIGNGPYRVVEWTSGERLLLERWDAYPGPAPAFKRIVLRVVPDANAALMAFEVGRLDELSLTPQQFARETDNPRFAQVGVRGRDTQWTTYYIGWNVGGTAPFLADRTVRQALSRALDCERIVEQVFFGLFTPAQGLFHEGMGVPVGDRKLWAYDLTAAARMLDDAGWRRDPADGWRYKTVSGERVRAGFTLNLVQGSQTSPRIADLYQQDLRKLGVDMTTRVLEWTVFNERNFKHEFEAYFSAWTPGPEPDDAWNLLHSASRSGGRNYVDYANPQVDALFEQARREFDPARRMALYSRIERIVHHDAPYTFLVNAPTLWAFGNDLRGVQYSPRGPVCFYPGVLAWWKTATNAPE